MERLSRWTSKHPWAYLFLWPVFLVYLAWKIPQALKEWGNS
jgi:hypothetical protein